MLYWIIISKFDILTSFFPYFSFQGKTLMTENWHNWISQTGKMKNKAQSSGAINSMNCDFVLNNPVIVV